MSPDDQISSSDWMQHKKYIMEFLKSLDARQTKIDETIKSNHIEGIKRFEEIMGGVKDLDKDVAGLKKDMYYKTGLIGILMGGIPTILALIIYFLKTRLF